MQKKTEKPKSPIYNTQPILDAIVKQYSYKSVFLRKVSQVTGLSTVTLAQKVNGMYKPSAKEIDAFAKFLYPDISKKEIEKCYDHKNADKAQRKNCFKVVSFAIDYEAIENATKNAGYSHATAAKAAGLSSSSVFHNWKKTGRAAESSIKAIARICNVPVSHLLAENKPQNGKGGKSASSPLGLVDIGETKSIPEIFKIINDNIFKIGTAICELQERSSAELKEMNARISSLSKIAGDLVEPAVVPPAAVAQEKPKQTVRVKKSVAAASCITKEEVLTLVNGYDENDDFKEYSRKINRMVTALSVYKKDTHNHVLHSFYTEMTATWGVVYDDLKKEYFKKYEASPKHGSMELLYDEKMYGQIFYNIIASDLHNQWELFNKKTPS